VTRRAHKPTEESRKIVRGLSGLGMIVDDIGRLVGITENTLRKYYEHEMAKGRAEANVRVARSMFEAATRQGNPNVVAGMFWLKNRAGWKDLAQASGGVGTSSLRVEFVAAPRQPEPMTIEGNVEPAHKGNGHDKGNGVDRGTFDVSLEP